MSLLRTVASLLLVGTSFTVLAVDSPARLQRDLRAYEISLKTGPTGTPGPVRGNAVNYSSTLVGTPTWTRPFADCTGATGLGPMGYHVQPFTVAANGAYDVTSVQNGWDGYLFVYQNSFNPAAPNTNCVAGDDDGAGGIGTSDILGVNLTAGTQYFVVTTAFENGEEGTFTNTLNGPAIITLGGGGPQADLSVVVTAPTGVLTGGTFTYLLTAANAGPDPATGVVVTDTLSPSVTFVSASCGATAAAGTVTWNVGALANGANATCTITVSMGAQCAVVDNVATITGVEGDPAVANNTSAISNSAGNVVLDGSFEAGSPSTDWAEASTNFGTPLCTIAACGQGTGTGPRTGDWWAWFGGIAAPETGSVTQSVTIPTGATTLSFWVEFPVCVTANGAGDFVRVQVDGNELWREDATAARCNTVGYQQVTVDVSAFADGGAHTLSFNSTITGNTSGSNFFVDDVEILAPPVCTAALIPEQPVPALDRASLALLVLLLGLLGFAAARRHSV
jgi:uncharacterized repeat protein (TIGR01451 family)